MELTVEYIPALIVAKDKDGNYVKISEANKDEIYYCPVCNGEIKARAIGSDKVQPHFYHITESNCSNESILHWMFKNWLFESGSVFKVDGEEFIVDSFEMEKQFNTPFGEYRPDLFIQTNKEDFFFEINYSSGKDKTFSDKWTHLNKKVVEVNVKELINCELYDEVPTFKTIFEDGKYTKEYKTYERKDKYSEFKNYVISANKEEQVKQLVSYYDWFWRDIKNGSNEDIKVCINEMKYDDAIVCTRFLKKIKCHDKFDVCKEEMFIRRQNVLNDILNDSNYCIKMNKLSPQRYTILVYKNILGVMVGEESKIIKSMDGLFNYLELKELIEDCLEKAKENTSNIEEIVKKANDIEICGMESEKFITVHETNYSIRTWRGVENQKRYNVNLIVNVYSEYFSEWIRVYNSTYWASKANNDEIMKEALETIKRREEKDKHEKEVKEKYLSLKKELHDFNDNDYYLEFKDSLKEIVLYDNYISVINVYRDYELLDTSKHSIIKRVEETELTKAMVNKVIDEVNSCKNNFWSAKYQICMRRIEIEIKAKGFDFVDCKMLSTKDSTEERIKDTILTEMNRLVNGHYKYKYPNKQITMIRKES